MSDDADPSPERSCALRLTPSWAVRASGARLWDAAGRVHADWSNADGAVLLGHADPEVEAGAAVPPSAVADVAAARLCAPLPAAPVARFTRNADAALACAAAVAVRATGRSEVLTALAGEPVEALAARLRSGSTAAVVLGPDVLAPVLAQALRGLTAAAGVLLVLDETATGVRRGAGGLQAQLRLRADLCVWGAGLANGRALGAVTGEAALLAHAPEAPAAAPASLAAAAATLARVEREDVALNLAVRGAEVQAMLEALAADAGLAGTLRVSGDPTAIWLGFAGPRGPAVRRRFTAQLSARGVHAPGTLHVGHRHDDADIGGFLDAAAAALQVVAAAPGEARAAA